VTKREKIVSVNFKLPASTLKRVDRYALVYDAPDNLARSTALRFLIEDGLRQYELTEKRRAALRVSLPTRSASIRAAYTKEAYRVEALDMGAPSNNQCSTGQRFSDLKEAREYYDSLEVIPGRRKELQRRSPGKMRYEPIEIEVGR
jgi:hypothetical protein